MQVFSIVNSGFCPGVKNAEKHLLQASRESKKNISIFGQLIHNMHYIEYLEEKGIRTIEELSKIPEKTLVAIRTHGLDLDLEKQLRQRFEILDLTCPKVKAVQKKIKKCSDKGYFVVISGKKNHPEVLGLMSYAEKKVVIEDGEDLIAFVTALPNEKRFYLLSQTTYKSSFFVMVQKALESALPPDTELEVENTICSITSKREKYALELQKEVDITFVIGDRNSSNAKKLFSVLNETERPTYFIEDIEALKSLRLHLSDYKKAQVVSSSSTPRFVEEEVVHYLENF